MKKHIGLSTLLEENGLHETQCPHCERRFSAKRHILFVFHALAKRALSGTDVSVQKFGRFKVEKRKSPEHFGGQTYQTLRFNPVKRIFDRLLNCE